jgi:hypothetical protein
MNQPYGAAITLNAGRVAWITAAGFGLWDHMPAERRTNPMRVSKEALALSVVVRRVRVGAIPFSWEVHRAGAPHPVQVSTEGFRSMEAAYQAGQACLADLITKRTRPSLETA